MFFWPSRWPDSGLKQATCHFFFEIVGGDNADDTSSAPLNSFKKRPALWPSVVGPSTGHCFIGPGVGPGLSSPDAPDLVLFILFFLFFSFLKNNALFLYIFSNKFFIYVLFRL